MRRVSAWIPRAVGVALVAAFLAAGCGNGKAASGLEVVKVTLGKNTYEVEVANTPESRERGLMHRDSMPADHGMIFVFPDEQPRGFWMKNTRIPLDIVFINAAGKVVSIHTMQPFDRNTTNSKGPAKWAVELNKGEAEKAAVKEGDTVAIPKEAADAKE